MSDVSDVTLAMPYRLTGGLQREMCIPPMSRGS